MMIHTITSYRPMGSHQAIDFICGRNLRFCYHVYVKYFICRANMKGHAGLCVHSVVVAQ